MCIDDSIFLYTKRRNVLSGKSQALFIVSIFFYDSSFHNRAVSSLCNILFTDYDFIEYYEQREARNFKW